MSESQAETAYRRWRWAILWIAAASLLLFGLGARSLWGSEDRWAEVVREMFLTGDFLHPRINWEPYFDKPLLSYWFIALCAWAKGGLVDEFVSRLPSALAALGALAATAALGKRLIGGAAAYYACWILLTIYSFAFWGRTAAADMENVVFTIAPLAWYFARKERPGFLSYFVFWALCAIGGQTKGLGAIVIPAFLVAIDIFMEKSWRKHLTFQSVLAAFAGAFVYFIPFMLEALTRTDGYSSSGLSLAFRENIQRFFNPFDHDEPFYVYFIYVPQLFLPWTPFLLLAGVWAAKSWRKLSHGAKWICVAALAVFAIFTLSGSRRVYYILPLLPLCALLCGAWLDSALKESQLDKIRDWVFKIYDSALLFGSIAAAIAPLAVYFAKIKIGPVVPPPQILFAISIAGALAMLFRTLVVWRLEGQERCKPLLPGFLRLAIPAWIMLFSIYSIVLPSFDAFRTGKAFAKAMAQSVEGVPPENVAFLRKASATTIFYMGLKGRAEVMDSPEELSAYLAKPSSGSRFLISERGAFESLPSELKLRFPFIQLAAEPMLPWEKSGKRKLLLFAIPELKTGTAFQKQ